MMSVYELKLSEDTLTAIKVTEELNKVEICGQDAVLFPNGKRIAAFYKLREDGYGIVFSSFELFIKNEKIYFPLCHIEDLSSDSPVNGFSWEGEECESPQHFIVLEKEK